MVKSDLPYFSIIIPTFRRPEQRLGDCLQSIACLDYPRNRFEIVIVDDGSPTPFETGIADINKLYDIVLLTQRHAGPAAARNTGAVKAKGDILTFIDDDCEPAPNWLRILARRLADKTNCAVGGWVINKLSDNPYSTASQMLVDYLYAYYNSNPNRPLFLATNNLALPAEQFHAVGGFDTSFARAAGEDREFCDRWIRHGYHMIFAPEALVFHSHALTALSFLRQQFNYGMGAYLFHQKRHCRAPIPTWQRAPISFYANLLQYPFSQSRSQKRFVYTILFMLSQLAITVGYLGGLHSMRRL